jgi:DNA-binding Lrp family transcriptional regulator
VLGPNDIIVGIEVESLVDMPSIHGNQIRAIPGLQSTTSLVSFPEPYVIVRLGRDWGR